MDRQPQDPGDDAARPEAPEVGDRAETTDRRELPEVAEGEVGWLLVG